MGNTWPIAATTSPSVSADTSDNNIIDERTLDGKRRICWRCIKKWEAHNQYNHNLPMNDPGNVFVSKPYIIKYQLILNLTKGSNVYDVKHILQSKSLPQSMSSLWNRCELKLNDEFEMEFTACQNCVPEKHKTLFTYHKNGIAI